MKSTLTPIRGKLTASVLTQLVTVILGALAAFKVFDLTPEQIGSILAVVGVVGIILTAYGILGAESEVTPVADAHLPAGTTVTVTQPGATPPVTTTTV